MSNKYLLLLVISFVLVFSVAARDLSDLTDD